VEGRGAYDGVRRRGSHDPPMPKAAWQWHACSLAFVPSYPSPCRVVVRFRPSTDVPLNRTDTRHGQTVIAVTTRGRGRTGIRCRCTALPACCKRPPRAAPCTRTAPSTPSKAVAKLEQIRDGALVLWVHKHMCWGVCMVKF
jgi:hypothetical protein